MPGYSAHNQKLIMFVSEEEFEEEIIMKRKQDEKRTGIDKLNISNDNLHEFNFIDGKTHLCLCDKRLWFPDGSSVQKPSNKRNSRSNL